MDFGFTSRIDLHTAHGEVGHRGDFHGIFTDVHSGFEKAIASERKIREDLGHKILNDIVSKVRYVEVNTAMGASSAFEDFANHGP